MSPARKRAQPAKKAAKKRGRPSGYKPEYAKQAAKLCALGATDAVMADFFGVTETTVNNWKLKHPEFVESLKDAKDQLDARVEQSLYRRAMGWEHDAVKILTVSDGNNSGSHVEEVPYIEHYPGDTTAQIFWLKNRQPEKWRDRSEVTHGVTTDLAKHMADAEERYAQRD